MEPPYLSFLTFNLGDKNWVDDYWDQHQKTSGKKRGGGKKKVIFNNPHPMDASK